MSNSRKVASELNREVLLGEGSQMRIRSDNLHGYSRSYSINSFMKKPKLITKEIKIAEVVKEIDGHQA